MFNSSWKIRLFFIREHTEVLCPIIHPPTPTPDTELDLTPLNQENAVLLHFKGRKWIFIYAGRHLKSLCPLGLPSTCGSEHKREESENEDRGGKWRQDDRLIKMDGKHLWVPRESCYRELITLTNVARVDSGRGLILHPRSWWLFPGNVTPVKAWLLCGLIEFTENGLSPKWDFSPI